MVEEILGLILRVALLVSFLFTAAALFVPELLMEFFTKEPALIVYGAQYLRIVSPSYLLCGASQMYLCIMKNSGRAFQSTVISGTMEAADIVMNLVLIYGLFGMPKMGVAGAALSTRCGKSRGIALGHGGQPPFRQDSSAAFLSAASGRGTAQKILEIHDAGAGE